MAIFLKYEGINGTVTAAGHEKWIDVQSMQWGVGRGISGSPGTTKDREATHPSVSEVTFTKLMDETSPKFFTEACVGKGKPVEIHLCKVGDKLETYMEYKLTNVMISGYSVSSGGDRPMESISLNFTKIEMNYIPYDDKHAAGSPVRSGYDLAAAKMV
jgi:type VI secretion system secreted protein Hcp